MESKERWRRVLRRRIARMTHERREKLSRKICEHLWSLILEMKPKRVFGFAPIFPEPDLWPLYAKLRRNHIQPAFPKVRGRHLIFYGISSFDDLQRGAFGILEPKRGKRMYPSGDTGRDLILVPCLGLDNQGHRLGHGGGYYDRWIARNSKGSRIGILFECQWVRLLPRTSQDARVHCAVTEKSVYLF